jgi:hypothetical protein
MDKVNQFASRCPRLMNLTEMVFFLAIAWCGAWAQIPIVPIEQQPYLLRVGRAEYQTRSCVLLKRIGEYHLERDSGGKAEVFEGELSPSDLARLQGWLDDERLQKLSPEQIVEPLMAQEPGSWQFNIFRGDHWQSLPFHSGESMKPYHDMLAPLVDWFNNLHNAPHRTIPEDEGKTNCLPPRKIAFASRSEEASDAARPSAAAAPKASAPTYVMRLIDQYHDRSEIESVCAIVYLDGSYQLERSSQDWSGRMKTKVYRAALKAQELEHLQTLVDEAKLKATVTENAPDEFLRSFETGDAKGKPAMMGFTLAWIPRRETVQSLTFLHNVWMPSAIGSHIVMSSRNESNIRELQRLVRTLPPSNAQLVKDAVPNKCAEVK